MMHHMLALGKSCFNVTSMHSFFWYQHLVSSCGLSIFAVRYGCDASFQRAALPILLLLANSRIPGVINLSRDTETKTNGGSFTPKKASKRQLLVPVTSCWHCFVSSLFWPGPLVLSLFLLSVPYFKNKQHTHTHKNPSFFVCLSKLARVGFHCS